MTDIAALESETLRLAHIACQLANEAYWGRGNQSELQSAQQEFATAQAKLREAKGYPVWLGTPEQREALSASYGYGQNRYQGD